MMDEPTVEQNNIEEIAVELSKLQEKIQILKKERDDNNTLTKEALTKRNEINQGISHHLKTAKEYVSKRDETNTQVKELKDTREKAQETLKESRMELSSLSESNEKMGESELRKNRKQMHRLNDQIKKLEWYLQTQILSTNKEKEIIQQLESLSEQFNGIATKVNLSTKETQLWQVINSSQKKLHGLNQQIINAAKESQIYHNLGSQSFQQVNKLRKDANDWHNKFLVTKKKADHFHRDFLSKVRLRHELRQQMKNIQKQIRKERRDQIQSNLEVNVQKAFSKYEAGENLSLSEFRLLVEKGLL